MEGVDSAEKWDVYAVNPVSTHTWGSSLSPCGKPQVLTVIWEHKPVADVFARILVEESVVSLPFPEFHVMWKYASTALAELLTSFHFLAVATHTVLFFPELKRLWRESSTSAWHRVYLTYRKLFTPALKFSQCTLTAPDKGCYCRAAGARKQAVKEHWKHQYQWCSAEMKKKKRERNMSITAAVKKKKEAIGVLCILRVLWCPVFSRRHITR